jgi:hypothetical protein
MDCIPLLSWTRQDCRDIFRSHRAFISVHFWELSESAPSILLSIEAFTTPFHWNPIQTTRREFAEGRLIWLMPFLDKDAFERHCTWSSSLLFFWAHITNQFETFIQQFAQTQAAIVKLRHKNGLWENICNQWITIECIQRDLFLGWDCCPIWNVHYFQKAISSWTIGTIAVHGCDRHIIASTIFWFLTFRGFWYDQWRSMTRSAMWRDWVHCRNIRTEHKFNSLLFDHRKGCRNSWNEWNLWLLWLNVKWNQ